MSQVEALLARVLGLDPASLGTQAVRELVEARLRARGSTDEASYVRLLQTDGEELETLLESAVVHETWFFREPAAFECLRDFALQRAARGAGRLRVLSVPCSTGEEPYSIAMTLLDAGLAPSAFTIEAVDVSEPALAAARRGVYGKNSFRGAQTGKDKHFRARGTSFELCEDVRRAVHFGKGNLLDPQLFTGSQFDVVFCKNLLIYLDRRSRNAALGTMDRVLATDGVLFAGHSESQEYISRGYERFGESGTFAFRRPKPVMPRTSAPATPRIRPVLPSTPRPVSPATASAAKASRPKRASLREDLATARSLADRGAVVEAIRACEAYLKRDAESAEAHCLLGLLRQSSGDLAAARVSLERAVYLDSDSHEALVHLALLHDTLGDHTLAAQLKRRAERRLGRKAQP